MVQDNTHFAHSAVCIAIVVNIGMWLERFVIVVISLPSGFSAVFLGRLQRHHLGLGNTICSMGLFVALLFLFIRFLP